MQKTFNVSGDCKPALHYMVDLSSRLKKIKGMVDSGQYFTINRARQYGKTTTLRGLANLLKDDYVVISLDFQMLSHDDFSAEAAFVRAFSNMLLDNVADIVPDIQKELKLFSEHTANTFTLSSLFRCLSKWCALSQRRLVLIIDEVDSAANNQVFLDFLSQLRGYYLNRDIRPAFHSVILAGVYDIKNMRRKLRPEEAHKLNSPWNIAADFNVDMSFFPADIAGMLTDYESDHHTGMDIKEISALLYDYTSGYPFLVSRLCKLLDENLPNIKEFSGALSPWSIAGVLEAVKILLSEKNTLFESLIGKLNDYPELKRMIYLLLFQGQSITYNADDPATDMAIMFGFAKKSEGTLQISNRIFETRLYNYFLTLPEEQAQDLYKLAQQDKNQFIHNGRLNMRHVLEKFIEHFTEIYGGQKDKFYEEDGRRYFLLYLKPIINGIGNYYVEAQTRNQERTDLIVDYHREQYIIELKIWRENSYNERGEKQLADYLEYYHVKKGYMLSFCFNKKKNIGVKEISLGDKVLVEAVV